MEATLDTRAGAVSVTTNRNDLSWLLDDFADVNRVAIFIFFATRDHFSDPSVALVAGVAATEYEVWPKLRLQLRGDEILLLAWVVVRLRVAGVVPGGYKPQANVGVFCLAVLAMGMAMAILLDSGHGTHSRVLISSVPTVEYRLYSLPSADVIFFGALMTFFGLYFTCARTAPGPGNVGPCCTWPRREQKWARLGIKNKDVVYVRRPPKRAPCPP